MDIQQQNRMPWINDVYEHIKNSAEKWGFDNISLHIERFYCDGIYIDMSHSLLPEGWRAVYWIFPNESPEKEANTKHQFILYYDMQCGGSLDYLGMNIQLMQKIRDHVVSETKSIKGIDVKGEIEGDEVCVSFKKFTSNQALGALVPVLPMLEEVLWKYRGPKVGPRTELIREYFSELQKKYKFPGA